MNYIVLETVTKIYNQDKVDETVALKDISLSISRGQVVALTGPSGSGKTSLLSLVGCMARPTSGKITIDGQNVVKLPERFLTKVRRESFGFIFQQFHLLKDLSVLENVLLPLYPTNIGPVEMKKKAGNILVNLHIDHKARLPVKQLSGGEQQRVAIARALINEPQVIIADEPTAHLDERLAKNFLSIVGRLQQQGKTVIIATHDPLVFSHELVEVTVHMRNGRVAEVSSR